MVSAPRAQALNHSLFAALPKMRGLAMLLALATEAAARTGDPQATVTKTDDVELLVAQLVAPLQSQVEALQSRVSALEEENASLWRHVQGGEGGAEASASVVLPTGEARRGRQLTGEPESSEPTCCRWTQDDACSSAGSASEFQCTSLHEYLEHKTTTHEFSDLDVCLGSDHTKWRWKYQASNAQVALSNNDSAVTTTVKTPLKVTHAASCNSTAPTLTLQMDTVVAGLTVSGTLSVGGTDIAAGLANATAAAAAASAAAQTASADAAAASTASSASCSGRTDTSWTDLTFYVGHSQACANPWEISDNLPRFKVICDIVYLAGVSCAASGTPFAQAEYVVYGLPQVTSKSITFIAGIGCYGTCGGGSGEAFALHKNSGGYLMFGSATHTTISSINLGGISYPLEIQ